MKRFIAFLMVALMLVSFAACGSNAKSTEFTHSGMTITLTDAFKEASYEGYTVCYDSADVAVFVIKEDFTYLAGLEDYTLAQYAELVHNANSSRTPTAIADVEGLTTFEYSFYNQEEDTTYKYFTTMFKGDDAFWTVQFTCKAENYETLKADLIKYAKSVDVTKE